MLILVASTHLEALEQKQYQLAINHIFGTQTMPVRIAQYQLADTPEGLERLLTRFRAYPARSSRRSRRSREGSRTVAPARGPGPQADRADRTDAGWAGGGSRRSHGPGRRRRRRERVEASVEADIYPALQRLRDYLADEYEAQARPEPGISSTTKGARRPIGSGSG